LYLARQGFSMLGVDNSAEAIACLTEQADLQKWDVVGQVADMTQVAIAPNRYQLIVADTSLDHLPAAQGERLAQAMMAGLAPGGYLYVSVFMVNDPGHDAQGRVASETAAYVKHYYQPDELRRQFAELTLLAYQEEYALDMAHGEPHYHGIARLFAQRVASTH
jgi:2-polyprenyl-3-methyl-5-hydroxy-6-metoxy-1,4-benzoquinol methylase